MAPSFHFKIVTPAGIGYEGEVSHARVPVENGTVGILANHAPYVTSSAGGTLTLDEKSGEKKAFAVGTGFFTVTGNQASFLTSSLKNEPK